VENRRQILHIVCEEPVKAKVTYSGERMSELYIRFCGGTGGKVGKGGIEQVEDYTLEMKIIN
jgi:hypothetical protein